VVRRRRQPTEGGVVGRAGGVGGPRRPLCPPASTVAPSGERLHVPPPGGGEWVIFAGTHVGTFDPRKGRLSVPAAYRQVLAQQEAGEVVLRRGGHADCLDIWPKPQFDAEVAKRIGGLDPFDAEYERVSRRLVAGVEVLRPDAEGRLVLPKALAEQAGLAGEIVFTGRVKFFQVWDAARHAAGAEGVAA